MKKVYYRNEDELWEPCYILEFKAAHKSGRQKVDPMRGINSQTDYREGENWFRDYSQTSILAIIETDDGQILAVPIDRVKSKLNNQEQMNRG